MPLRPSLLPSTSLPLSPSVSVPVRVPASRVVFALVAGLAVSLGATAARAQNVSNPTFAYVKPEEKPPEIVEWKSQVKGGFVATTGNSRATTATFGGSASRKEGMNKLALDAGAAYGRSNVRAVTSGNGDTVLDRGELGRLGTTSTNNWFGKGRYDRFFTINNAIYLMGNIGSDKVAGKTLTGGGQLGYSRQLLKSDHHLVLVEAGYDLSFEKYETVPMGAPSSVSVQSARFFAGEQWKVSDATGVFANFEALFNLNKEGALSVSDDTGATKSVSAFKDTRLNGKAGITTTLWKDLSFGFSFTLHYDQNPAPLGLPSGATSFAADYVPFANKLDTITEASLILTLL